MVRKSNVRQSNKRGQFLMAAVAGVGILGLFQSHAAATTYYWDTNGTTSGFGSANGTWGTDTLWSTDSTGAIAPTLSSVTSADTVNFGTNTASYGYANGGSATVTISGNQSLAGITVGSQSGAITLSGGTLTFSAATVTNNSSSAVTIATDMEFGTVSNAPSFVGKWGMSDGGLITAERSGYVGNGGSNATFTQSGGIANYNRVGNALFIGGNTQVTTTSVYNLNGGALNVKNGNLYVGWNNGDSDSSASSSTLNVGGGMLNATILYVGYANNKTHLGTNKAILNVTSGEVRATKILRDGSYNATFNFAGGTLRPYAGGNLTIGSGATAANVDITLTGSTGVISSTDSASANRTVNILGTIGQTGTQGLTFSGGGTTNLFGNNTYTGETTISQGTLALKEVAAQTLGGTTSTDARITNLSSTTGLLVGQAVSGTGIAAGAYIVSIDTANQVTLNANGTAAGATSATFAAITGASLANSATINLNGGTFDTSAKSSFTIGASQTLKGQGTFTNSATTTIDGGLQVGQTHGTNTGGAQTLSITNGNTTLASTATTYLDLFTGTVGSNGSADKLNAAGRTLTLGGTLNIAKAGTFTLAAGQSWDLFDATTISSSFSSITGVDVASQNLKWNTSKLNSDGILSLDTAAVKATIGLSGSATNTNYATAENGNGGQVTITGSGGKYKSEIDELTDNKAVGSVVLSQEVTAPTYAMLWLKDGTNSSVPTATELSDLRADLGTSVAFYDASQLTGDEKANFSSLLSHYAGFSMLVKFSGTGTALNWDLGSGTSYSGLVVDKVAVVPEPASLGALAIGAMGLLSRRRRKVTSTLA